MHSYYADYTGGRKINRDKIILDLCGGTGGWSNPYKEAGYDVRVITLPENDVRTYLPPQNVYGILAAPPCTMFSLARTTAKTARDLKGAMEIVSACLNIIWTCRFNGKLGFWALENPVGYLRQFLGIPKLTYNPFDYGDAHSKKTDIWGFFKEPKKNPCNMNEEQILKCRVNNRDLPHLPLGYKPFDGNNLAARRAITPPGFAKAFFNSNR